MILVKESQSFLKKYSYIPKRHLMFKKQLHITQWGRNIRFALATVIVFWTFVEICGRNGFFNEIWNDPMNHPLQMALILAAFVAVICTTIFFSRYISKEDV